jgi:RNA polymerase primary sigma factor
MSKKLNHKPFFPPRRTVKRGAPPVIRPRRGPRKPLAVEARATKTAERAPEPALELEPQVAPAEGGEAAADLHGDALELEAGLSEASLSDDEAVEPIEPIEPIEIDHAEIAIEDEELAEPEAKQAKAQKEEASNFLAMYFREMAELDVLKPEDEFRQARDLEELEIGLWEAVFSWTPSLDLVLKVIERTMDNSLPEFKAMRRAGADDKKPSRGATDRRGKAARKAAEKLRAMDIDRRLIAVVLGELEKIAVLAPGRIVEERLPFNPKQAPFKAYHARVQGALARVQRAKNEFVKANLRLVVSIARRFNHGRMPLADLIQEGNIGLIKAVERFDHHRGYRFSTYASWWIRHAISRALADKGRAVRLPVHMIDAYHRLAKAKRELSAKLGRTPTSEELEGATQIPAAKIEKMRTYLLDQSVSLDKPVSDEDGRRFIDFVQDPNQESVSPVDEMSDKAVTDEVRQLLHELKPIEADILRQRFGLDDDRELTLKEIGEKYNLSRERIRQLQEQALTKMRRALQRKDLM